MYLILCSRGGGGGEGSVTMHYVGTVYLILCSWERGECESANVNMHCVFTVCLILCSPGGWGDGGGQGGGGGGTGAEREYALCMHCVCLTG